MLIYIEPLVAQNLCLTYFIAVLSYRFLGLRHVWWRSLLAAMLGGLMALFYPLLALPFWVSILCKMASGCILCVVLYMGKCKYWKRLFAFYMLTFLFGGCIFFISCLKYGSAAEAVRYSFSVNVWVTLAVGILLYFLLRITCVAYRRRKDLQSHILKYRMVLSGREIEGNGYLDTGNLLYDTDSGLPVIVLGIKTIVPYLSDNELALVFSGHADQVFKGARKMKCAGVGGNTDLLLVQPDEFIVYLRSHENILYDVTVGLSFSSLTCGESYNAILHPALIQNGDIERRVTP